MYVCSLDIMLMFHDVKEHVGEVELSRIVVNFMVLCRFFERLDKISTLPPEQAAMDRELLFLPFNSHYIVASLSPLLFILMVVQSTLMMLCKAEKRFIVSILSIPVSSPNMHTP